MFKKILVPLDGSTLAEAVLPYVEDIAKEDNAIIEVLTVSNVSIPIYAVEAPIDFDRVVEHERQMSKLYLDDVSARLTKDGIVVKSLYAEGPVAQEIVNYAELTGADLIAMSTHGRSGVSRWLLGSVADKVLHSAKVPVLLIRPDGHLPVPGAPPKATPSEH